jgi:alkanesulfonate monooxygenase SsuD/methylene tetrahydromethanopterin reductase-like flavin-dependent oxidoreductase (luciferase family)
MHVGISSGFANHRSVDDTQFVNEEMTQLLYAAELGFESIWITEHHFSDYSISPNPLQYLTWLAARTKTTRLGTQVIVVPWHDPVRLAEQIAVLDQLSGGRLIVGFGRGLSRIEYEGLRVDQNIARELFDEIVPMVMNAMETGFIEGGDIFKQPRREIRPRPYRSLKGRAFCAAGSPSSMISAAKLGLGRLYLGQPMVSGGVRRGFTPQDPQATGKAATQATTPEDAWLAAWKEAHPNEPPVAPFASNLVFIDESSDRAKELAATYAANTMRAAVKNYELTSSHHGSIKGYEGYANIVMKPEDVEKAAANSVNSALAGNPQEVLEQLDEVRREREPQGMVPHVYTGGMPHEDCMRSIKIFAEHCLSEMKSWPSAPWTIDGNVAQAAE